MLVHRLTFTLKMGTDQIAIEMLQEAQTILKAPHGRRIVQSYVGGTGSTIVMDLKFENLSELEAFWAEWYALPETPAFMEKWQELLAANTSNSVFTLVE
jgi:hypothetical protein